jgi:transposase
MYLKTITIKGITRLYLYESFYTNKKTTSRLVETLGCLDELRKIYPDPITHFKNVAIERSVEKKQQKNMSFTIDTSSKLKKGEDNLINVGYGIIKQLYCDLELDKFWNQKSKGRNFKFNLDDIFRLLVISRVLYPASKKATYDNRGIFFENFGDFSLDDVYAALDIFAVNQDALQKWIYDHSENICPRDLSVSYFDCTNYYFDIGRSDMDLLDDDGNPIDENGNPTDAKYRKRGPEKNHRPDPIIEMGLLMDKNGIPIAYDLFPGNESEKLHMRPIINRIKRDFSDTRIIFVADRGLNTSDNIYFLNGDNKGDCNHRDGYVYGQSIRGADAEFKEWVLKKGYKMCMLKDDSGSDIKFIHKSRIHPKEINVNLTIPGSKKKKKKSVKIDQKQMVYYSEKYAKKQRLDRQIMVERAKDLIKHPKKYDRITSAGSAAYVLNIAFDKKTGEIIEDNALLLNLAKINEESKYDGYYSIVTSELNMPDIKMREVYRGLAQIEDTFKISKTDLESRPVFVWTNEHIDAHFSTCFSALVLIRLLQTKLGNTYPVGQLLDSLRKYNCTKLDLNTYQFLFYNEILADCEKTFGIELNNKYRSQLQVRRMLRY